MQQTKPNTPSIWIRILSFLKTIDNALPSISPATHNTTNRAGLKIFVHGNVVTINTRQSKSPSQTSNTK